MLSYRIEKLTSKTMALHKIGHTETREERRIRDEVIAKLESYAFSYDYSDNYWYGKLEYLNEIQEFLQLKNIEFSLDYESFSRVNPVFVSLQGRFMNNQLIIYQTMYEITPYPKAVELPAPEKMYIRSKDNYTHGVLNKKNLNYLAQNGVNGYCSQERVPEFIKKITENLYKDVELEKQRLRGEINKLDNLMKQEAQIKEI